mmetsp:Transcript_32263/g.101277  ORF Transcript_32263/g.101277 Transcript_32263/m.101277 type:complete len:230 (-) Transcript_32263:139-828(-)
MLTAAPLAARSAIALCSLAAAGRGHLGVVIRAANLTDPGDCEALCCVRKPVEFVVEQGSKGFLGQVAVLEPEVARRRRVQARLGSAIRDKARVLIAADAAAAELAVIGTVDCVALPAGKGRRAMGPELPQRLLIRNLWVAEAFRRQGIGRRLMDAAEELAAEMHIEFLSLDVLADNEPARRLYEGLGFTDLEPPPVPVPNWLRGALSLGKALAPPGVTAPEGSTEMRPM